MHKFQLVLTVKRYYRLGFCCSDKSQSPIFKGIRTPALRQSGIKVKYVRTRSPSPSPIWCFIFWKALEYRCYTRSYIFKGT